MLKRSIIALFGCLLACGPSVVCAANNQHAAINLQAVDARTAAAEMFFNQGTIVDVLETNGQTKTLTIDENTTLASSDVVTMIKKGGLCLCNKNGSGYKISTPSDGTIVVDKKHCALILMNDNSKVTKVMLLAEKTKLTNPFFRLGGNVQEEFFPHHHSPF